MIAGYVWRDPARVSAERLAELAARDEWLAAREGEFRDKEGLVRERARNARRKAARVQAARVQAEVAGDMGEVGRVDTR